MERASPFFFPPCDRPAERKERWLAGYVLGFEVTHGVIYGVLQSPSWRRTSHPLGTTPGRTPGLNVMGYLELPSAEWPLAAIVATQGHQKSRGPLPKIVAGEKESWRL